ncbi:MAG: hypothetical protein WDM85_04075 [Caulobacteraceae bacterium]
MARLPDVRGAMHDILHPFADEADEWKQAEADMEAAEGEAATITEEEANGCSAGSARAALASRSST